MLLFVYSNLKDKLEHYKCLGTFETKYKYPLINLEHPFLLDVVNLGHFVRGKIFEIPIELISVIDEYEDAPRTYVRGEIEIKELGTCQTYFKPFIGQDLLKFDFLKEI